MTPRDPSGSEIFSIVLTAFVVAALLALVTVAVVTQNIAAAVCFVGFGLLLGPVVRAMVRP